MNENKRILGGLLTVDVSASRFQVCSAIIVALTSLLFGTLAARADDVHRLTFFHQKSDFEGGLIEIGKIDTTTQLEEIFDRTDGGNNVAYEHEISIDTEEYYTEVTIFIDIKSLPDRFAISPLLRNGTSIRALIPLRLRTTEPVIRGFKITLPTTFGNATKDRLEGVKSTLASDRSAVLEKYLTGVIGFELLGVREEDKRRWARMRYDGIYQLAISEKSIDLIQIPRQVKDSYIQLIEPELQKKIEKNVLWMDSNYLGVDAEIARRIAPVNCRVAETIVAAMDRKMDGFDDRHLRAQSLPTGYLNDLGRALACTAGTGS